MTILHTETHDDGLTTIQVRQEWPGAGLHWFVTIENGFLGTFRHRSSGCFYQDQPDEKIHGTTFEDVVQTTAKAARRFLKIEGN